MRRYNPALAYMGHSASLKMRPSAPFREEKRKKTSIVERLFGKKEQKPPVASRRNQYLPGMDRTYPYGRYDPRFVDRRFVRQEGFVYAPGARQNVFIDPRTGKPVVDPQFIRQGGYIPEGNSPDDRKIAPTLREVRAKQAKKEKALKARKFWMKEVFGTWAENER